MKSWQLKPSFAMTWDELNEAIGELEKQCTPWEDETRLNWDDGLKKRHYVHKRCLENVLELECCECRGCEARDYYKEVKE